MNSINLFLLTRLPEYELVENYEKLLSKRHKAVKIKSTDFLSLQGLVSLIQEKETDTQLLNGFHVSYKIPQIGKEFDLLKVTESYILNIELKSELVEEGKILEQLKRNRYYLEALGKKVKQYTYVMASHEVFSLSESGMLIRESIDDIIHSLSIIEQERYINDLDTLFRPRDFLVSPINTPERFISDNYFLTHQQEEFKRQVVKDVEADCDCAHFGITGGAGTGKTLLLYDLAKHFSSIGKCCVVHCGMLSSGHVRLNGKIENLRIISAKHVSQDFNFTDYKFIFVDECHRIHNKTYSKIIDACVAYGLICFWSWDEKQILSKTERRRDIVATIKELKDLKILSLSKKIRTNPEIQQFIEKLRDQKKDMTCKDPDNIDVLYADNFEEANRIIDHYESNGYTFICYTPSKVSSDSLCYYKKRGDQNTHEVIGQEFDKVILVLNDIFRYDEDKRLRAKVHPNPDYYYTQLLFQGLTRAREKLCIVVEKNYQLFAEILSIFENQ